MALDENLAKAVQREMNKAVFEILDEMMPEFRERLRQRLAELVLGTIQTHHEVEGSRDVLTIRIQLKEPS